ncbi:DUF4974 domain-containing protein [Echinicola sediminis]
MKYYTKIEDLLFDPSFKEWVQKGEPKENLKWTDWVESSDFNGQLYQQAKAVIKALDHQGDSWEDVKQKGLFGRIEQSIQGKTKKELPFQTREKGGWDYSWLRVAAVLLLVFMASLSFLKIQTNDEPEKVVRDKKIIVKSNPAGQKSKLFLPDGSTVFLNAASQISYLENFGKENRNITLIGEAFFEVAHDTLLPFRVQSGEMVTEAVGTSFNINAYPENGPSVQLATGKVRVYRVEDEEKDIFLEPGEAAVLQKAGINRSKFDPFAALGWKKGVLSFTNIRFSALKLLLERWYAVEINMENHPQRDEKISGEFDNASLKNVLESLGYTLGFDYSIDHKKITVKFKENADD